MYVLAGLNALTNNDIDRALSDEEAGVRLHAIRLAEGMPLFFEKIAALTRDDAPQVKMQAVLSIGSMENNKLIPTLVEFTLDHLEDPWMRIAVLSSEAGSSMSFFKALYNHPKYASRSVDAQAAFIKTFSEIVTRRDTPGEVDQLVAMIPDLKEASPTTSSTP